MDNKPQRMPLPSVSPEPPATPYPAAPPVLTSTDPVPVEELRQKIIDVLCTCFDPEIPVNVYELGLIYDIAVSETGAVQIRMTLTSPACPAAGSLPPEVEHKVRSIPGVSAARAEVIWDPPWTPERMSEAARLQLGMF